MWCHEVWFLVILLQAFSKLQAWLPAFEDKGGRIEIRGPHLCVLMNRTDIYGGFGDGPRLVHILKGAFALRLSESPRHWIVWNNGLHYFSKSFLASLFWWHGITKSYSLRLGGSAGVLMSPLTTNTACWSILFCFCSGWCWMLWEGLRKRKVISRS